jgi:hypothetical protein
MRFYDVPVNQSVPTEANRGLTSYRTLSNNLSFLGVVAYFVGKFFKVSDFLTLSARESSH